MVRADLDSPDLTPATFAERLRLLIGDQSVNSFAERSGVPEASIRSYLRGAMPGLDKALALAETGGATLDWLASGRGPMRATDAAAGLPNDKNLIARVSVAIADAYKEIGHPLSPARAGEELHTMLTLIVDASESPDEYLDQVPVMAKRLRKRLREAVAAPGTGKASA